MSEMINGIKFPDGATSEEKNLDWRPIASITDDDLGFNFPDRPTSEYRFNTRLILKRPDQKICLVKSMKYGYCQIPGGGIDDGESIEQGLRREAHEEAGFEIKNIRPLGVIFECRNGSKHAWSKGVSFCYTAESGREVGTAYMEDEIEEGFAPIWVTLEEAIKIFEDAELKLKSDPDRSYSGAFSTRRDLSLLKYFKKETRGK